MKSSKIKKIFAGLLALIMCVSLTGCMDKKVKTITVNVKNHEKIFGFNNNDLIGSAIVNSMSDLKISFTYSKDNQKLKKAQMSFVIDSNKLKIYCVKEFKKTDEYKTLEKESPSSAQKAVDLLEAELETGLSKDRLKEKSGADSVKKLSNGKIKIVAKADKDTNKKDIKKIEDIDKTIKAIKKSLKKDNLNSKDYTIKVKNYE